MENKYFVDLPVVFYVPNDTNYRAKNGWTGIVVRQRRPTFAEPHRIFEVRWDMAS